MKRTHQTIQRLYWIDAALRGGGYPNATDLSADLGVSPKTILKDMGRLRDQFRAPLTYDPAQRGFAYRRSFRPNLPMLPAEEIIDLARALRRRGEIEGTALEKTLLRLLDALLPLLPAATARQRISAGTRGTAAETGKQGLPGTAAPAEARLSASARGGRARARKRLLGTTARKAGATDAPLVAVSLRFDRVAGPEILEAGLLRREEVQLLTDGGFETTLTTRDPDALLLELLRWAPNFEIGGPAWVRRRLPTLLRRLLKQTEGKRKRKRLSRSR
jgi:predicted DNA-binding transcriptional regulator YafY